MKNAELEASAHVPLSHVRRSGVPPQYLFLAHSFLNTRGPRVLPLPPFPRPMRPPSRPRRSEQLRVAVEVEVGVARVHRVVPRELARLDRRVVRHDGLAADVLGLERVAQLRELVVLDLAVVVGVGDLVDQLADVLLRDACTREVGGR